VGKFGPKISDFPNYSGRSFRQAFRELFGGLSVTLSLNLFGVPLNRSDTAVAKTARALAQRADDVARARASARSLATKIEELSAEIAQHRAALREHDGLAAASALMGGAVPAFDAAAVAADRARVADASEALERLRAAADAAPVVFDPMRTELQVALSDAKAQFNEFRLEVAREIAKVEGIAAGVLKCLSDARALVAAKNPEAHATPEGRAIVGDKLFDLLRLVASAEATAASESAPLIPPPARAPEPSRAAVQILGEAPDHAGREDRASVAAVRDFARHIPQHQRAAGVNYSNFEADGGAR
jgi:hypothetical protein